MTGIKVVKCIGETPMKFRELLIDDLNQIKSRDLDDDRPLKLLQKEEVKKNIGRSPDYGDCFVMRMYFEVSGLNKEIGSAQVFYPGSKPVTGVPNATPSYGGKTLQTRYQKLR